MVDDNPDTADRLGRMLGLAGHQVRVVHEGPRALAEAAAFAPDIVLLDIGLPGMDSYEVARRLKREPGTRKALLVAVTGYGQDEDRKRAREAGFDRHLVKPVEPTTLEELLAGL